MGKKRRKKRSSPPDKGGPKVERGERDNHDQTLRLVNELLSSERSPDGVKRLRQVAVVRGLGSTRRFAWPILVGCEVGVPANAGAREGEDFEHRDAQVVTCDVNRCLFHDVHKRPSLRWLLNACVGVGTNSESGEQDVYYYQGLHDIASVLLLVLGSERVAFDVLRHLVKNHLRDCTRSDLVPVLESLDFVFDLLKRADPELHDHVRSSGVPCHFALSWRLTWFSHDMHNLDHCARLFDIFLASHPLMPLYIGVCCLVAERERILAAEAEFATMHQLLSKIKPTSRSQQLSELIRRALQLHKQVPPHRLGKGEGRRLAAFRGLAGAMAARGGAGASGDDLTWAWLAMVSFSGLAAVTTATAALTSVLSFWDGNMQFQLL